LSVRRQRGLELLRGGFRILLCGGDDLAIKTGEDTELCLALRATGGRLYYDPRMKIEHFMPADRLTWPKALQLMRAMGEASPVVELYLIALDGAPFAALPAWRKTWLFRMLKAFRHRAGTFIAHPLACLRKLEGSLSALEAERNKGRVATLWSLRGRYGEWRDRIRQGSWVRVGPKAEAPSA
jgi:hypothetical protein